MPDEPRQSDTAAAGAQPRPRVVVVRDEKCLKPGGGLDADAVRRMLDRAVARLIGKEKPLEAWKGLFTPADRVAVKVNTLGQPTHPVVASAVAECLRAAGVPAGNIIIWDRSVAELRGGGYKIRSAADGVRCLGTDSFRGPDTRVGYESQVATSGSIGSRFSVIVSRFATALINVPVLKDHSIAGLSGGLKNFFGAIHNPNKYHDNNCEPYVADLVAHRFIRPKWQLTICDGTRAQYHGGPARHPGYTWPLAGLIVSDDFVAADAVAADLIDAERKANGLPTLAEAGRPVRHIATAGSRGLGQADLRRIERIEA